MDDFDKDEFDEFGNFDREELNRLFRERMQDEDFRQRFMGIIGGYQRDYEGIMKLLWGMNGNNPFNDPFSGLSSSFNPNKDSFFKGLDFKALNEDGWEGGNWTSDDGETYISSFTRSFTPEEFYYSEKRRNQMDDGELPASYVIEMLEDKLDDALEKDTPEGYNEAATLLKTINSLKEGEKTKKENKSKEK
jgi:hypothetical protein